MDNLAAYLVNLNFVLLDGTALDFSSLDGALDQNDRFGLSRQLVPSYSTERTVTDRYSLRILQHLLRHLVLILISRDDQDTLEGVGLLSESQEDNFGTYQVSFIRRSGDCTR